MTSPVRCTLDQFERDFADRHLLHGVLPYWASRKPEAPVLINHDRGRTLEWITFDRQSTALARRLMALGLGSGDFLATFLPMLSEHILLEYACFKIGVIHTPLDLRLRPPEVIRAIGQVGAKAFVYVTEIADAVRPHCPTVEHWLPVAALAEGPLASEDDYRRAAASVRETDGAQVIFTTGSTGSPKPALLSHRGIALQNYCLGAAFGFTEHSRLLVNLPPSHVGGQAEALMTTLFWGGTAVHLELFDPARSLAAIQQHRVGMIGQIPAMFQFEWRQPDYSSYDLSSLELAIYGGQQVLREFLERMARMAPEIATGLGLTECSGFCTYTARHASAEELAAGLGRDMPAYPMSIREPMREDGMAGGDLPDGEIGHVCFRGPQTFLGYVNDPAATAQTLSADGYLYTGDMGRRDAGGLHLSGRSKWLIKPAGYQVFPGDVENHIAGLERVASCGVVGVEHRTLTEAIVAFIEPKPGAEVDVREVRQHVRGIASYMRPLHYVLIAPGAMPLNRVAKIDYLKLQEMAREEVARLRAAGRWD